MLSMKYNIHHKNIENINFENLKFLMVLEIVKRLMKDIKISSYKNYYQI